MGTGTVDLGSAPALAWMAVLLDASIKGAVILLIAGALSGLLRRTSAATRHLVWLLAVASLIALPVLSLALPAWRLPILPQELAAVEPVTTPMTETGAPPEALSQLAIPPEPVTVTPLVSIAESLPEPEPPAPTHWSAWLLIVWGTGATAAFLWLLAGTVSVWRTARRAQPVPESSSWAVLLKELAGRLGVKGAARLLQSEGVSVPMIWGLVRPLVLLPADGERWSEERRRIVLLHELAHIRRKDCLTQMVAQLACTIYWFNPLAWLAARQMRRERERACDDLVLAAGLKASNYAGHLLEIARSARSLRWAAIAGVAMARPSNIEGRLLAILDAKRSRRSLTRLTVALALIAVTCALLPLAAIRPVATAAGEDSGTQDQRVERRLYDIRDLLRRPGEGELTAEELEENGKQLAGSLEFTFETDFGAIRPDERTGKPAPLPTMAYREGNLDVRGTPAQHQRIVDDLETIRTNRRFSVELDVQAFVIDRATLPADHRKLLSSATPYAALKTLLGAEFADFKDLAPNIPDIKLVATARVTKTGWLDLQPAVASSVKWQRKAHVARSQGPPTPIDGLLGTTVSTGVLTGVKDAYVDLQVVRQRVNVLNLPATLPDGGLLVALEEGATARAVAAVWMGEEAAKRLDIEDCVVVLLARPRIIAQQELHVALPHYVPSKLGLEGRVHLRGELQVGGPTARPPIARQLGPWKKQLANGAVVEILAAGRIIGDKLQWWGPDGSPTTAPDIVEADVEGQGTVLALRMSGSEDRNFQIRMRERGELVEPDLWYSGSDGMWMLVAGDRRFITLRFEVASGPWRTLSRIPLRSKDVGREVTAPQPSVIKQVTDLKPLTADSFEVTIQHKGRGAWSRFAALDNAGKAHGDRAGSFWKGNAKVTFALPIEGLAAIVYQERLPDTVEFRNLRIAPPSELGAATPGEATVGFGPVIERVVNDPDWSEKDAGIDLDTGTLFSTPAGEFGDDLMAAFQWAVAEGIDAVSDSSGKTLRGLGMVVKAVPNERWAAITPEEVAADADLLEARTRSPLTPIEMHTTTPPATYVFRTREGGAGILQITGFTAGQRGVKIRYKMLRSQGEAAAPPSASQPVHAADPALGSRGAEQRMVAATTERTPGTEAAAEIHVRLSEFSGPFPKQITEHLGLPPVEGGMTATPLTGAKLRTLVDALKALPDIELVWSPRLTVYDTRRAQLATPTQENFVKDVRRVTEDGEERIEPVIETLTWGRSLDTRPTISSDRRFVKMELGFTDLRLVRFGTEEKLGHRIQVPVLETTELKTTVNIPSGGAVALSGLRLGEGSLLLVISVDVVEPSTDTGVPTTLLRAEPVVGQVVERRGFVRLVVGQDNMTFEGQETTWEELPVLLEKVPHRPETAFELATGPSQFRLGELNQLQDQATKLARQWGFKHVSLIGVHPLGSKGGEARPPQPPPRRFVRLVVATDSMTFEGEETTWEQLPALLEKVPDRPHTVLELAVASDEMTLKEKNQAQGRASSLSRQLGFQYLSYIGVHPLGSKGTPPAPARPQADTEQTVREKLQRKVSLSFADTPLEDVAEFLRRVGDVSIVVDQRVLATVGPGGYRVSLALTDVPLDDALDFILDLVDLKWTIRRGVVFISDAKGVQAQLEAEEREPLAELRRKRGALTATEKAVLDKFQREVTFSFVDTPLEDVVDFMRHVADVNIVVDQRVLAAAGPGGYRVSLALTDVPLEDALDFILDLVDLDWVIRRGVVFISDVQGVQAEAFMRIYDVRDIIGQVSDFAGPRFDVEAPGRPPRAEVDEEELKAAEEKGEALVKRIQEEVEPGTWKVGRNSIVCRDGILIIANINDVHQKIQRFLEGLRGTNLFSIRLLAKPQEGDKDKTKMVNLSTGEDVWVSKGAILLAAHLAPKSEVEVSPQAGRPPVVKVELTPAAAKQFQQWTEAQLGERMAIVADGEVWSVTTMKEAISNGRITLVAPDIERAQRFSRKLQEYFDRRLKDGRSSP